MNFLPKSLVGLVMLSFSLLAFGQSKQSNSITNTSLRSKININREWRFVIGDSIGAQNPDYNDAFWSRVGLPHSAAAPYFMGTAVYNGYVWYRKQMDIPAAWSGKTVTLEFEGVFIECEVYVNGYLVGKHVGGYTGFNFDITNYLTTGTNLIAVRVNNYWKARVAPRAGDHQYSAGIYRDVYLNVTDKVHVDWYGTFITTPTVSKTAAVCQAQTEVRNENSTDQTCTVKTEIYDPNGALVSTGTVTDVIAKNSVKTMTQLLPEFSNPLLWSPLTPYLHKAFTTITVDGAAVDTYETSLGVRWFTWTSDQGFFLNGDHYYLLGANVHQDHAGWGDGVANSAIKRDVQLMKDAGFNCIRGSHYPHDPAFSQACDELGMIFFSENAFWGMGGGSGDRNSWGTPSSSSYPTNISDQPYFNQSVLSQLKDEIRIHRNRASIAAWSMCNEAFFSDDATMQAVKNLLNAATDSSRVWDPSRAVAIGGAQRGGVDKLGKGAIAFYNGDGATLYPNPGVPNMVSEYGINFDARPGTFDPGWGELGNGMTNRPAWRSGHVVWCGFDHGTVGGPGLALLGVVDYFRIPKRSYYWYKQAYAQGIATPVAPVWSKTGVPAKLKIEASTTVLESTDGVEDAHLVVTVLDANGLPISNNVPIKLEIVSGPGEFPTGKSISFAAPSTNEASDIVIRDGQCAIEFRSYYGGTSWIKATSAGLIADSISMTTNGIPVYQKGVTPETVNRPYHRFTGTTVAPSMSDLLLVKSRPVKVSSTLTGTNQSNVNDGSSSTSWKPDVNDTEKWCVLSMEAVYCINRIQIEFPTAGAYRYVIEVPAGDNGWIKVIDQSESENNNKIRMAYGNLGQNVGQIRIRFTSDIAGLAEVKVGGASEIAFDNSLLTGTVIGTAGSWDNVANATKDAAFDFDSNTFFDAPSGAAIPHWVGLDLGYLSHYTVTKINFYPRSTMPGRMLNGTFEVANKADFSDKNIIFTIQSAPVASAYTTAEVSSTFYTRYVRYASPSNGNGNVAELEFHGEAMPTNIDRVKGSDSNLSMVYDRFNKLIRINIQGIEKEFGHWYVYGMDGKMVESKCCTGNDFSISTSKMRAGVYCIKVLSANRSYTRKFVVY